MVLPIWFLQIKLFNILDNLILKGEHEKKIGVAPPIEEKMTEQVKMVLTSIKET